MSQRYPRVAALNLAWQRAEIDAPAFCNREGRLLARAVKCLVDPLVVKPRTHPEFGLPVLDHEAVDALVGLFADVADRLAAASQWYQLLRAERRRRGITAGNPQELYFPRAFELATVFGFPEGEETERCAEILSEVHADAAVSEELRAVFEDAEVVSRLEAQLAAAWPENLGGGRASAADFDSAAAASAARTVLGDAVEPHGESFGSREVAAAWAALSAEHSGQLGELVREDRAWADRFALAAGGEPVSGAISVHPRVEVPAILADPPGAGALDRALVTRVRAAARRIRSAGNPLDGHLVEEEIERVPEPWGLFDAELAAVFVLGLLVAGWVKPLAESQDDVGLSAVRSMRARARNEAHVLYLRRALCAGQAVHPSQEAVVTSLRTFDHPYLRRLWTRLHGRDVNSEPVESVAEAIEVLEGIVRSTLNDHRQRIRLALEKHGDEDAAGRANTTDQAEVTDASIR